MAEDKSRRTVAKREDGGHSDFSELSQSECFDVDAAVDTGKLQADIDDEIMRAKEAASSSSIPSSIVGFQQLPQQRQ